MIELSVLLLIRIHNINWLIKYCTHLAGMAEQTWPLTYIFSVILIFNYHLQNQQLMIFIGQYLVILYPFLNIKTFCNTLHFYYSNEDNE